MAVGDCGDVPRLQVGGALDPATIEPVDLRASPTTSRSAPCSTTRAGADVDFPGVSTVDGYATDQCLERFERLRGRRPTPSSELDVLIVAPDEDGWDDGDRRIACVLYHTDFEQLTGSVAATGR